MRASATLKEAQIQKQKERHRETSARNGYRLSSFADGSDGADCPNIGTDGECCRCIGQALFQDQFIWLGGDRHLAGIANICFQDSVRDLGVILDQELSISLHINQLTRSCYYQLRQLRVVSRSLSSRAAAAFVHAFVTSRLYHCSSILVG